MSYSGTMSGPDWLQIIQNRVININNMINDAKSVHQKWYDFSYGKSMADIAGLLSISEQEATDLNAAFTVFKELYDAFNNVAVAADDRKTKLLRFV